MISNWSCNADTARWAFGLKSRRDIHGVPVQISPVCNGVTDIDSNAKADDLLGRLVAIIDEHLLLHPHGTARRPINAIENDEQGIAPGLNDPAAVLLDRGVDYVPAKGSQPFKRSNVIKPNETAVTDHIGIDYRDQPSPIWRLANQV